MTSSEGTPGNGRQGTAHFVHVDLHVHYRQAYLVDDEATGPHGLPADDPAHPVGIIRVEEGAAFLITGVDTGTVGFTVAVADRDPGPELEEFEDIVEVGFRSAVGRVALHEWGGPAYELPPLPAGPGWYRLRYHARGMDGPVDDDYLLQIWPQESAEPRVVKSSSATLQYWLHPG
ncbi:MULTISPECIES: hypothetical protein [Nonomuraea]|uniref:Uncharacterized protein n=2 Tax=Nonomuraea TaxID=83681 RepID=A0ABW1BYQ8_9ACTN|nr:MULTISPECIES: hypothetical protein [Nonomuraea]MDA0641179.1 hypothetical protein [Nonomuraea ferruginea]TXK34033.1 hypothetical protein FR742_31990 [Nonomuraea sp. C10]